MKPSYTNTSDFIHALSEGDNNAYQELYLLFFEDLCFYANRILGDLDDSKDTVQAVISKVWDRREDLNKIQDIKSYLYRSVYNHCINKINKEKTSSEYKDSIWQQIKEVELRDYNSLQVKELGHQINTAIANLPEQCQKVFMLSRFNDKSYKEIAEELEISTKAVEGNISRALKQLRYDLREYLPILILIKIFFNKG